MSADAKPKRRGSKQKLLPKSTVEIEDSRAAHNSEGSHHSRKSSKRSTHIKLEEPKATGTHEEPENTAHHDEPSSPGGGATAARAGRERRHKRHSVKGKSHGQLGKSKTDVLLSQEDHAAVNELKEAISSNAEEFETAATRLQKSWRKKLANRHVALIRIIYADARKRHTEREDYQRRLTNENWVSEDAEEGGDGESKKKTRWKVIMKEVNFDMVSAVRKCAKAYTSLTRMRNDPIKVARVHRIRTRLNTAKQMVGLGAGADFWRKLQGDLEPDDEDDDQQQAEAHTSETPFQDDTHIIARKAFVTGNIDAVRIVRGSIARFLGYDKNGHGSVAFDGIAEKQLVHKQHFAKLAIVTISEKEDDKVHLDEHDHNMDQMNDDDLYTADKAARKIQQIFHGKRIRRLEARARVLRKVRTLGRLKSSMWSTPSVSTQPQPVQQGDAIPDGDAPSHTAATSTNEATKIVSPQTETAGSPEDASTRGSVVTRKDEYEKLQVRISEIQNRLNRLHELEEEEIEFNRDADAAASAAATAALRAVFGSDMPLPPKSKQLLQEEEYPSEDPGYPSEEPGFPSEDPEEVTASISTKADTVHVNFSNSAMLSLGVTPFPLKTTLSEFHAEIQSKLEPKGRGYFKKCDSAGAKSPGRATDKTSEGEGIVLLASNGSVVNMAGRLKDHSTVTLKGMRAFEEAMHEGEDARMEVAMLKPQAVQTGNVALLKLAKKGSELVKQERLNDYSAITAKNARGVEARIKEGNSELTSPRPSEHSREVTLPKKPAGKRSLRAKAYAKAAAARANHPEAGRPPSLIVTVSIDDAPQEQTVNGEEWGLRLGTLSEGKQLIVLGVGPGVVCTSAKHNQGLAKIRAGDLIIRVGDHTECEAMARTLRIPTILQLNVEVQMTTLKEASDFMQAAVPLSEHPASADLPEEHNPTSGQTHRQNAILPTYADGGFSEFSNAAVAAYTDGGFSEFASAAVAAYTDELSSTQLGTIQFFDHYSDATLPRWLSPEVFGPHLRDTICSFPAGDMIVLLHEAESGEQRGALANCAHIWNKLHLACSTAGGKGVWALLVAGGSSQNGSVEATEPDGWIFWRMVLFLLSIRVMQQNQRQLVSLMQGWSLGSVSADWGRQLVEIEETMGWCSKNLDLLSVQPTNWWGFASTDRPDVALAPVHAAAAVHLPPVGAWALLLPDARRQVRGLEAQRYERSLDALQDERTLQQAQHRKDIAARGKNAAEILNDLQQWLPENKLISFSEYTQIADRNLGASGKDLPCKTRTDFAKPWKPGVAAKGVPTRRLRQLRIW